VLGGGDMQTGLGSAQRLCKLYTGYIYLKKIGKPICMVGSQFLCGLQTAPPLKRQQRRAGAAALARIGDRA
jgi:hypothetical protein